MARQTPGISRQNASDSPTFLCPVCGGEGRRKRRWQAFCSPRCRKAAWLLNHRTGTYTDVRRELAEIKASLGRIEAQLGPHEDPRFELLGGKGRR